MKKKTLDDYIREIAQRLRRGAVYFGHGTDNAYDEAVWIVTHTLAIPFEHIQKKYNIDAVQQQRVEAVLKQRIEQRIPCAYIFQRAWFADLEFIVNQDVLIPRSPVAELILCGYRPWLVNQPHYRILDLCCGSGCIGLASAHYIESATVDLCDISAKALEVARQNQAYRGLTQRTHLIESDLFSHIKPAQQYDLIVSNPPYVDQVDLASMPAEYHHEPRIGLEAGEDGLLLVRQILYQAAHYLKEDGLLIIEVGNSASHVERVYPQVPFIWLEFVAGGDGVLLIDAPTLKQFQSVFQLQLNAHRD